jgi:nitrite reductase/ring-hydroxylating ferredoxin subunit/uncharacterized membrane protein
VHFPIGLFTLSIMLDIGARIWTGVPELLDGAYYSMLMGVAMALVAAVPGFVDYTEIRDDHPAGRIATTHMLLNLLVVGLYAVNIGLRLYENRQPAPESGASWFPLFLSIAAFTLLGISGHLGGKLVFDEGVSVGRHRRKTRMPQDTLRFSCDDDMVIVANLDDLPEGETLRVDVNGTVITIARSGEELYAFQEFCTHRYGPLSEGCFKTGEVECPWHRSRFDMRTGQVTQGPAKVDIKTFQAKIVDGKVAVIVPRTEEKK